MRPVIHASPFVRSTGWVDVSDQLPAGLTKSASNGRANLQRRGDRVVIDMNVTVTQPGLVVMITLPFAFRIDAPLVLPFTFWTTTAPDHGLPSTAAIGYIGGGGTAVRPHTALPLGTAMVYLELPAANPMP